MSMIVDHTQPTASPENAFRAPKERELARNEFPNPVPASRLGESEDVDWLWEGYIARGHCTLLTGLWKGGKSTLVGHLISEMNEGGQVARAVTPARVLVVAEESPLLWARRRDEIKIGDHAEFDIQPFLGRPTQTQWYKYLEHLQHLIATRKYDCVIFDTIAGLWPVNDENDASRMMHAITPLRGLTQSNVAVLLVHHPRKGDASEGQASRGSGALPAFVDIILEFRRYDAKNRNDRRRVLTAYSRFHETPPELVMELTDQGYLERGTQPDASRADRQRVVTALLAEATKARTVDELREAWPNDGVIKPSRRTLGQDLAAGADSGFWQQTGTGHKGDPFRYTDRENSIRASSHSLGARNESSKHSTTERPEEEVSTS